MRTCVNHPGKKAFSICHGCGKDFCELCLDEGKEFYYCKNPECQKILKKELSPEKFAGSLLCPNCNHRIKLSENERISGRVHCSKCESFIDFNINPPRVLHKANYSELVSSLNQGDIGIIKSILDSENIDYYVFGENFLSVDPLIQPARFFVNETQIEKAKELLKDIDLHIWGASSNQIE
jgi:transcription elongation factor Elf1